MGEAAVFCVEAGLSVLCKDELEEAVGVTTCRSVVSVFFLSSSQSQSVVSSILYGTVAFPCVT